MAELRCKLIAIRKGNDGKIRVFITYPGALNEAEFVFNFLPAELATEWFSTTTKEDMDKMRGAPDA